MQSAYEITVKDIHICLFSVSVSHDRWGWRCMMNILSLTSGTPISCCMQGKEVTDFLPA